ncbi:MAG: class I SAM-dependent methyltransferase [Lachnospiraceae bacterium]|nr:class I SAM-dependent methyltransferase [Lachnospiraceae bacterium]
MGKIEDFYNKFNEEKRLDTRHGQIEYRVTMKYVHDYLDKVMAEKNISVEAQSAEEMAAEMQVAGSQEQESQADRSQIKILDIGAATGRYSVPLSEEGYDVTAVELVKYNLGMLKKKNSNVTAIQGNALNLKKLKSDTYDLTLLFGPMYHLMTDDEKMQALREAKRVTKKGGYILVAYIMNEYAFVIRAIQENMIHESIEKGLLTEDFHVIPNEESVYDFVRIEDIDRFNAEVGLAREKIISPDGPANYIRPFVNKLDDEGFEYLVKYQLATCERLDIIGAAAHTVDILRKD